MITTHKFHFVVDIQDGLKLDIQYMVNYCIPTFGPLCIYSTISVWTIVRPEYSTWRLSFTILPYYSTALIISKNFHILSSFHVNEMGSHWVLFLLYLNIVLSWPEDGRSRPKQVAKYNLTVIIASCLDACCVLTVHNILYKFEEMSYEVGWWMKMAQVYIRHRVLVFITLRLQFQLPERLFIWDVIGQWRIKGGAAAVPNRDGGPPFSRGQFILFCFVFFFLLYHIFTRWLSSRVVRRNKWAHPLWGWTDPGTGLVYRTAEACCGSGDPASYAGCNFVGCFKNRLGTNLHFITWI